MDTGGFGSTDRNTELDNKIFVLSLLLSSYFVLNTKNVIDRDAINHLNIMNDLSNFISINNEVNQHYKTLIKLIPIIYKKSFEMV
jgi:hypothetical protein